MRKLENSGDGRNAALGMEPLFMGEPFKIPPRPMRFGMLILYSNANVLANYLFKIVAFSMRSPIQRITGTAIELPSALYLLPSAAGLPLCKISK